jgi:hypothetical protein
MHPNVKQSFAFLIIAFNHDKYILEHLESIKYLVEKYGANYDVDIIVNDDCSRDKTKILIDEWLRINSSLFRNVKVIYNNINLGTCASVNNMLGHVVADRCKITAGDDVYSFENIFELTKHDSEVGIIFGRTLYLIGDELKFNRISSFLATATQLIYRNNNLLHRFKHFSYNNAPNMLYAKTCLLNINVRTYLQNYDVIEDWPLQIGIARQFPLRKISLINSVLVYYRRTPGSTYIIANQRFIEDKVKIYDDLIRSESNPIEILRLKSRKFCFNSKNRLINKILNLDFYYFSFNIFQNLPKILNSERKINIRVCDHRRHYEHIKFRAVDLRKNIVEKIST